MADKDLATIQDTALTAGVLTYYTSATTVPLTTTDTFLFHNDGRIFLVVVAGSTASTLTVATTAKADGDLVVPDRTVVLAQGTQIIGPFRPSVYNDAKSKAAFSLSAVTDIQVALVRAVFAKTS